MLQRHPAFSADPIAAQMQVTKR